MPPLHPNLRRQLETAVIKARDIAEKGARVALQALAVEQRETFGHMNADQRRRRVQLRARAKQLGDEKDDKGRFVSIEHLVVECAYEHWHRMLFARFLAENSLLMHPGGVAVTLKECKELAESEGAADEWELAGRYAARMLPQIFRPDDPVLQVQFAPEHKVGLEKLLAGLPPEVFTADDGLGWVYQFWQSKRKDEVNASGRKIGADELPAVTQLFTEHYMVLFLLHNTIGAWWAGKYLAEHPDVAADASLAEVDLRRKVALDGCEFEYLRFVKVEAASSRLEVTRQDAASTVGFFREDESVTNLSGNLPHWRQGAVTYFVTFRTADSLPQDKLRQWQSEREQWLAQHPEPHDDKTKREYYERFPERIEHWLDQGYGACHLKDPVFRQMVEDALRHFDGERYDLDAFVVSANHVHVIVTPKDGHELSAILHSWKSFTANQINKHLGQSGAFWQKESFDHIVRSMEQLERTRRYIRDHKVEAAEVEAASSRLENTRQDAASTWRPAAGTFPGWPVRAAELKILDPCCGSGHFLVAAFELMVRLRMREEGLPARDACDSVLRDNIHGLEIDERCCQIAAFALAMAAWRFPDAGGYRVLPELHIACTGIGPQATEEQWLKLAEQSRIPTPAYAREPIRNGLLNLHLLFSQAPTLGSLINPRELPGDLIAAGYETIQPYLAAALSAEISDNEVHERAVAAAGMVKAAELLAGEYALVVTNVPYLGQAKQVDLLKAHLEAYYREGKADLATAFVLRCLQLCIKEGTAAIVTPQNWLFLATYGKFRESLLKRRQWHIVARLGEHAFESSSAAGAFAAMVVFSDTRPEDGGLLVGIDVSAPRGQRPIYTEEKADLLRGNGCTPIRSVLQSRQLNNPSCAIGFGDLSNCTALKEFADVSYGLKPGQVSRVTFKFWEVRLGPQQKIWVPMASMPTGERHYTGRTEVCLSVKEAERQEIAGFGVRGERAWGRPGVLYSKMTTLGCSIYQGEIFDANTNVITPKDPEHVSAIYSFVSSADFRTTVRSFSGKLDITCELVEQLPFDIRHWQKIAAEKYPHGLPEPQSDDPTQWLFHGYPGGKVEAASSRLSTRQDAASTLQVAVARLLGYRWPAELDDKMRLSSYAREMVRKCDELLGFADKDGIVCIPSSRGERPAADRLRDLLAAAYGDCWSPTQEAELLEQVGFGGKSLDDWLRDGFFEQHCKLFHHRPFIWHVWDGRRRDGFHALVNYHKLCGVEAASSRLVEDTRQDAVSTLNTRQEAVSTPNTRQDAVSTPNTRQDAASTSGRRLLETLTYAHVGDWIKLQKADVDRGRSGAEARLIAAQELQRKLELILAGEPPYDIFVRWKPIEQQPIGWEPDLNDGVRLNIRPFMKAGVLRKDPNINWKKDRGTDPKSAPWYHVFKGERINDFHLTLAEKQKARSAAQGPASPGLAHRP